MKLPKLLNGWLKKAFCKREVQPGQILVLWKDVDETVHGWCMSADNEDNINVIGEIIGRTKLQKLKRIVGDIGWEGNNNATFPPCSKEDL